MIIVISGTNRKDSGCLKFATTYYEILKKETEEEVHLIALDEVPFDWVNNGMYEADQQDEQIRTIQDKYLIPADKFVFISPEYNGSFPGVLKLFIDACSVREYKATFSGKKAALVGIATGRAGNLRGMDHLTGVLHHMGAIVMPKHLPISKIGQLVNGHGAVVDEPTLEVMENHAKSLLEF